MSVQYSFKVLHNRGAFMRWEDHILHSLDGTGGDAEAYNYPNPPIMAVILYPMARMPSPWGALTWFYLKVGLTLLSLLWVFRLVQLPGRPFPLWRVSSPSCSASAPSSATCTTATSTCSSSSWWSPP